MKDKGERKYMEKVKIAKTRNEKINSERYSKPGKSQVSLCADSVASHRTQPATERLRLSRLLRRRHQAVRMRFLKHTIEY